MFHVLAHVEGTAGLASSSFDPLYCEFSERHLGPASARSLGDDVRVLADVARSHSELARLQVLAWVFHDTEHAGRARGRDLATLVAGELADPVFLKSATGGGAGMEVLRAAAELEAPFHARLPPVHADLEGLERALNARMHCAPALKTFQVSCVRSLRLRGRVVPKHIWVGAPALDPPLTAAHAAWQACHEATVTEVGKLAATLGVGIDERTVEHAAIVLLTRRASENGLADDHDAWCATFGNNLPGRDVEALPDDAKRLVTELPP